MNLALIKHEFSKYSALGCILVIDNCSVYSLAKYNPNQLFYCPNTKTIDWWYAESILVEIIKVRKFGNCSNIAETLKKDIIGKCWKFYREVVYV